MLWRKKEGDTSALEAPPPLWLALDQVHDGMNLGNILRSAQFFGAAGVLLGSGMRTLVGPVASKASSGAMEQVHMKMVSNLPLLLSAVSFRPIFQSQHWKVVGLSVAEGCISLSSLSNDAPTILVVGNEGSGLRKATEKACNTLATINPGTALESRDELDSLNVGNAVAVAAFHLKR
jgi:21S rRNA (GM2251-2'-O)-methyltransferase